MDAPVSDELTRLVRPVDGLERLRTFEPGSASHFRKLQRIWRFFWRTSARPAHRVLKAVFPAPRWNIYFVFSPQGDLSSSQLYSMQALRSAAVPLLVIVACEKPEAIPPELMELSDALIWKSLSGYDFSAYRIGLEQISEFSPGADILVMNDSVFGPFGEIDKLIAATPWRLTGFTSSALVENHIQSYAFILKSVDAAALDSLSSIMPPDRAFDLAGDVILCQEIQFARVAARHMSVGSLWHGRLRSNFDPMLNKPLELIEAGMPFLKKSLIGKMRSFQDNDSDAIHRRLVELGHPPQTAL